MAKYRGKLASLDRDVLQQDSLFSVIGPRYKGQIFEEWFETNHRAVKASPQPYILISDDTEARRKCSDGFVEGTGTARGNTLIEAKAYTSTAPPDREQETRMGYYAANLGKSWTLSGTDKKVFSSLIYTFNNVDVAQAWEEAIGRILGARATVMVGNESLAAALARLDSQIEAERTARASSPPPAAMGR